MSVLWQRWEQGRQCQQSDKGHRRSALFLNAAPHPSHGGDMLPVVCFSIQFISTFQVEEFDSQVWEEYVCAFIFILI